MTEQEIFDEVWDHFVVKKYPRSRGREGDGCMYRGRDGARCAAGLFISDEQYDWDFEGRNLLDDTVVNALRKDVQEHRGLLRALQRAHDECPEDTTHVPPDALRAVAEKYGLTVPPE